MTNNSHIQIEDCWNTKGVWSKSGDPCPQLQEFCHCRNCPVYSKAGRQLLDRPLTDEYQEELVSIFLNKKEIKREVTRSAFFFKEGTEWLALPANIVNEVVYMGPIHSIPHKNSRIFRGIVNIRGRLELCVSIGGVLRLEGRSRKLRGVPTPERLIVAVKDGQSVVFPVTEVIGSIRYKPSMITPLPVTVSGSKAVYTKGILAYQDKDIGFLDDNILFRILTRNLA